MPVEGKLREKVIVKGSNFGTDKSKVKVYFVDEAAERLSTVIGIDNNTLLPCAQTIAGWKPYQGNC